MNAGIPVPVFSVSHGEFKVVMKNDYFKENITSEEAILEFCSVPRLRSEFKPKSSKQRYVGAADCIVCLRWGAGA